MHSGLRADSYSVGVDGLDTLENPHDISALMRGFELSLRARNRSPKTIRGYLQTVVRYGDLGHFFNWCVEEDACVKHPMDRMKPPSVPEVLVPIVADNDLRRLLKACEGSYV